MKWNVTVLCCVLLLTAGCRGDQEKETVQALSTGQEKVSVQFQGCSTCHPEVRHDLNHDFPCSDCHKGDEQGRDAEAAHAGLVAKPSHPDFMTETCGSCHPDKVEDCRTSLHFTLRNKVNLVREHFGARDELTSLTDISPSIQPATPLELVDDMLRRRCLRCHVFYPGDTYASTQRGTGCAACHMSFSNGKLLSHKMAAIPDDLQCLGCHYANFVGSDYYGRYEHDLTNEYRTPFTTSEEYFRPYGVEYHELAPDIHRQRGLSCVDCHSGHQDHDFAVTCRTCHTASPGSDGNNLPENVRVEDGAVILTALLTGSKHTVPQMRHPAHEHYGDRVSCQVCHAQWSYNDTTTHLVRSDTDDYEPWESVMVQSSSTVENLLYHNLHGEGDELPPAMPDTVTGRVFPGVWYKGFTERRWERMLIRTDQDNRIKVFRPVLDLRLSYVDSEDTVVFDNVQGTGRVLLPYTPHTTGKAGLFYLIRFAHLLNPEQTAAADQ